MIIYHFAGDFANYTAGEVGRGLLSDTATTAARTTANASFTMRCRDNVSEPVTPVWSASVSEFWMHFNVYILADGTSGIECLRWSSTANGGNNQLQVIRTATANTYQFQYWNGSSWNNVAGTFTLSVTSVLKVDIHVKFHASAGAIDVYVNDSNVMSYSGALTSQNSVVDKVKLNSVSASSSSDWYYSELYVAADSTVGSEVVELKPTTTGATNQWTNTYTEVDEAVINAGDLMFTGTLGNKFTFDVNTITGGAASKTPLTMAVCVFGALDHGGTIADMRAVVRTSSTDYQSVDLGYSSTYGYKSLFGYFEVNPNTTLPWTVSELNAVEIGVITV